MRGTGSLQQVVRDGEGVGGVNGEGEGLGGGGREEGGGSIRIQV